ncbi:hypothetical protein [Duganella sp. BJB476]|uniref:hypothetical protein n=1 Tax=Duganella sp. BJB476 TaxID=1871176 RepID=UPI000E35755C|nr:hypothetical protein [Duganella sp. BJB476]RFP36147.1 hypothetical protein D0T21_06850 [Duganella sp. BJB476]
MKNAALMTPSAVAAMVKAEDREMERAAFWLLVPPPARVVAMMVARLPRDRANEPLTAFSKGERHMIAMALTMLESHIGMALRCMRDDEPATKAQLH